MDSLFKKLDELSDLLKQFNMAIKLPKPKMGPTTPKLPKIPGVAPTTKKNPKKVAQQVLNKPPQPKAKFSSLGQWSLK